MRVKPIFNRLDLRKTWLAGLLLATGTATESGKGWAEKTPGAKRRSFVEERQADRSPIRGKGVVEKTTSTDTSKYSAIRSAR